MGPSFSSELKFLVEPDVAQALREWARAHLAADPHGGGDAGDQYRTTSLYFDTARLDTFHRRGSYGRAKYRIRRYGDAPEVFLERKLKRNGFLCKRRMLVPLVEAPRKGAPYEDDRRAPLYGVPEAAWFERRVQARQLAPVCEISYVRVARAGVTDEGPVRVTIDTDITALVNSERRFLMTRGTPVLSSHAIVEMKFRDAPPALLRRLIQDFRLDPAAVSKYRLAMTALGLAHDAATEAAGRLHA
ncbi:MAG: polyphosphate polymerase domain-containing protein [Vicinamibacterales bacterium]